MRNLKRVLALAMALVMILGMMVIGSSAASYSDAAAINEDYVEAVEVLSGLGVFKGTGAGFAPKQILDRASAAALVYRVITGDVTDKQISLYDFSSFADVQEGAWYTGYITYAANGGYIKGYNGNAMPNDTVTGIQVLAMMLRAAGYGQNGEFEGAAWKDGILTTAKDLGVISGISTNDLDKGASRELVAQLLFNVLTKVKMVAYSPILSDYIPVTFATDATTGALTGMKLTKTLGEKVFKLACVEGYVTYNTTKEAMVINGTVAAKQDIFDAGRYGHIWVSGPKAAAITDVYYDDTLLATNYDGTAISTLTTYSKTNKKYIADMAKENLVVYNGEVTTPTVKKGTEVALYTLDGKTVSSIVVVNPIVDVMSADYLAKNDKVKIQGKTWDADVLSGYEDLAKGDVFTYVDMYDGIRYYEEIFAVEGQKTAYTTPNKGAAYITFGGEDYELSGLTGKNDAANLFSKTKTTFDKDAYVYLDRGGYVVYTSWTAAARPQYGMVIDTYSVLNDAHTGVEYYANILTTDGEETGYVAVNTSKYAGDIDFTNLYNVGRKTCTPAANADYADLGILVQYTVKDGVYTLTDATKLNDATLSSDYKAGAATLNVGNDKYAIDDDSVVFYYWYESIGADKWAVHYGVNVGKYNADDNADGIPSYGAPLTEVDYLDAKTGLLKAAVFNGMAQAEYDQYAYVYAYTKNTTTGSKLDVYTYYGVNAKGEVIEFSAYKSDVNGNDVVGNIVWYIERFDGLAEFGMYDADLYSLVKVGNGNTVMARAEGKNTDWDVYMNSSVVYDLTSTKGLAAGDTVDNYDFYWDKTVQSLIVYDVYGDVECAFVIDETLTYGEFTINDDTCWYPVAANDEPIYYYITDGYDVTTNPLAGSESTMHVHDENAETDACTKLPSAIGYPFEDKGDYTVFAHVDVALTAENYEVAYATNLNGVLDDTWIKTVLGDTDATVVSKTVSADEMTLTVALKKVSEDGCCKDEETYTITRKAPVYTVTLAEAADEDGVGIDLTATLSDDAALDVKTVKFLRKDGTEFATVGTSTVVVGKTATIEVSEGGSYKVQVLDKDGKLLCESALLDVINDGGEPEEEVVPVTYTVTATACYITTENGVSATAQELTVEEGTVVYVFLDHNSNNNGNTYKVSVNGTVINTVTLTQDTWVGVEITADNTTIVLGQ